MKINFIKVLNTHIFMYMAMSLFSSVLIAEDITDEKIYRIELVCFENVLSNNTEEESLPEYVGTIIKPNEKAEITNSDMAQVLTGEISLLKKEILNIKNSKQHRYIYNNSWSQQFVDQRRATPVYFYGGEEIDNNYEVEGLFSIRPIRNLFHVKLDVILRLRDRFNVVNEYRMTQTSRMKAGDPYYFDHPKFGSLLILSAVNEAEYGR